MGSVNHRVADIVVAVALAVCAFLLYRRITGLWWTYDDAYLLHVAIVHPARDHFLGSSIWRSMPQRLFTPLLTASYDAELSLFGVDARAFYRDQLALLSLSVIAIFATARLWLRTSAAACAALVFIAGAPLTVLATELMLVHYIESIILGAASLALFTLSVRRNAYALSLASSLLYMLAMLAKEIAVPLVAVLLLMPEENFRRRVRMAVPHCAVLFLYAIWRRQALGEWIGGYGWTIGSTDLPHIAAILPLALLRHLGASSLPGSILLILLAVGIALRARSLHAAAFIALLIIASVGPTLPMAKKFESRFAVMMWLCCAVIAIAGFATIPNARIRNTLLMATACLTLVVNRQTWSQEYARARRMSDEGQFFFALTAGDALRKPAVPPAAMSELRWLKEEYLRKARGTEWFYDDIFLCTAPTIPPRVFTWLEPRRAVVLMNGVTTLRDRYCSSIRDEPLVVSFHHEDESLSWNFGPYEHGTYAVVMGDGVQAFEVPRSDAFRLPGITALALRVRYEPAGREWVTYSPELHLDFSRRSDFTWHR